MNKFGSELRRIRKARRISLRKLAKRVELSFTYLDRIELGALPPPAVEASIRIADALQSWELRALTFERIDAKIAECEQTIELLRQKKEDWQLQLREA